MILEASGSRGFWQFFNQARFSIFFSFVYWVFCLTQKKVCWENEILHYFQLSWK